MFFSYILSNFVLSIIYYYTACQTALCQSYFIAHAVKPCSVNNFSLPSVSNCILSIREYCTVCQTVFCQSYISTQLVKLRFVNYWTDCQTTFHQSYIITQAVKLCYLNHILLHRLSICVLSII
jgi:hypothetical protein